MYLSAWTSVPFPLYKSRNETFVNYSNKHSWFPKKLLKWTLKKNPVLNTSQPPPQKKEKNVQMSFQAALLICIHNKHK